MFLKKIALGAAAAAVLGGLLLGRETLSYVRTGATSIHKAVKAEVPVEFEIARAHQMVEQLVPDVRQCMHVIAEQQVDIEHLQAGIDRRETELAKQKGTILALRKDIGANKSTYSYAGHTYASDEVRRDLATRFERFKAAEETLAADRKILSARQQMLKANQEKLNGMMQAQKDLEVRLEQLEARLQTVRAAETVSQLAVNDSNLGQVKKLMDDLNKQLDVQQRRLDIEGKFTGLIPVEAQTPSVPSDLDSQIDSYFGDEPADAAPVASPGI